MKILIVEDTQYRIDWFSAHFSGPWMDNCLTVCTDAAGAINQLSEHVFDLVLLDHDLSGRMWVPPEDPDTGSEVVRYLVKNKQPIPLIIVHSHNEPRALEMTAALMNAGYAVCRTPFKHLAQYSTRNTCAM